jgi:uncharacterized membrane protein (DUF2068 family)
MDGPAVVAHDPGEGSGADSGAESGARSGPRDAGSSRSLTRREAKWLLKRCAKKGHLLAHLDDVELAAVFGGRSAHGPLLRCLRCGDFSSAADPEQADDSQTRVKVIGTPAAPVALSQVPLALRGGHGRKLALLRVLAVERGARGLVLLFAAAGIARLANSHVAVAEWLARVAKAAQPLGEQLGWDPAKSPSLDRALDLLGQSGSTFTTVAWLLGAYGVLQLVEGVGLWGGWLWAEYLAAVATSVFIPIEVYELSEHATVFKAVALLVNVAAVGYLVFKGRLFGVRGGHPAYLAEVRDSTLLAEELRDLGRPTDVLTSHHLV